MYVGTAAGFSILHPIFAQGFMTGHRLAEHVLVGDAGLLEQVRGRAPRLRASRSRSPSPTSTARSA